jgi:Family of unknown function (DUF6236)
METALYFPYIRVPQTFWFTQVLLYWDRAASIVPQRMWHDGSLGPYMSELIDARLVDPIMPEYAFYDDFEEYNEQFLALLNAHTPPAIPSELWRWEKIHSEKASALIFFELMDRGLARPVDYPDEWHQWWLVEETTAGLYMTYLAGSVCRNKKDLFPVTDEVQLHALFGSAVAGTANRLRELRYAAITQALPMPSRLVEPAEIASFKAKYGEKLCRLRRYLNNQLVNIARIDDDFERNVKIDSILQEIGDDVAELRERMSKRNWSRTVLAGVGGVFAPTAATAGVIASGGNALGLGLGIAGGVIGAAVGVAQGADTLLAQRAAARSPLAYAVLAGAL